MIKSKVAPMYTSWEGPSSLTQLSFGMHATGTAQYGCIHIIMLPPMHARVSMKFSKGWFSGRVLAHRTLIDKRESTIAEFQVCFDDGEVTWVDPRHSEVRLSANATREEWERVGLRCAISMAPLVNPARVARIVATVPGAIMNPFESAAHVHEPAR